MEAAREAFAERGFRNTTIREICRRARAKLAAVNYHFGDKKRLYAAVMEYAHTRAREKYPLDSSESADTPPAQRLHAFVHHLMFSLLADGVPCIIGQCLHHRNARLVIQRLFPRQQYGPEDIEALADHITRFSLGALGGLAKGEDDCIAMTLGGGCQR